MITYAEKPWLNCYEEQVPAELDFPEIALKITYQELNELADAVAAALVANGFNKGDRAVIYMANTPQFVGTYYGILKAGGIVIATNPLYSERELTHQLADCGAETVFVMSLYYPLLKSAQSSGKAKVKRIIVTNIKEYLPAHLKFLFTIAKERKGGHRVSLEPGDIWYQDFVAAGRQAQKVKVDVAPDDIALLQYTGGTTGLSKGAIALHRNLVSNTIAVYHWLTDCDVGTEVFLVAIPLFHSYGMITGMSFPIMTASTMIVIPDPRNQKDVLGSINKFKPTIFPGVPAQYVAINNNPDVAAGKYDIKSIRVCISGSAPLMLESKERFEELTGGMLIEGYGLTEAHVVTHANPVYKENKPGSIGLPLPGYQARIVDPEDGKDDLPVGEIGELIIKGPSVMHGYWQMPTETANALRDGWLYTGDIARMDKEGYFFIEDRKKDMIIAGGYNIYPREVEEVLSTHPAIQEVAVAGVADPKRGETVKAWIVKREGDPTTEAEIIEWSKKELAKYKYPRIIEFRKDLPRTTVGKVLKRELVKEHMESSSEPLPS
jgi:long-chain acyl-CoA synthetase